jgi:hypothetical protein
MLYAYSATYLEFYLANVSTALYSLSAPIVLREAWRRVARPLCPYAHGSFRSYLQLPS